MPAEDLEKMFRPRSIAVIGASEEEGSVGRTIVENLANQFKGDLHLVNPNRESVLGIRCIPSVKELGEPVDLSIIATPAATVPGIVKECGQAGIPAIIIISAGFGESGPEGRVLEEQILETNREYGMRILGPNCLGLIVPSLGLNASFLDEMPGKGSIALISQSGALGPAILDWSISANVGFSCFVSLGNMADINFGDLIDFFGQDPETRSILMYMESIKDARSFVSASRGFARSKPIVAVKSGKFAESAEAAASHTASSHTGRLTDENKVYDAAFQRVGVTRVDDIEDLFNVSEILAVQSPPKGPRLVIITNAGGPGIMATDVLLELRGELGTLSKSTTKCLSGNLPPHASKKNPIDIAGDADGERYRSTIECCLRDKGADGVLVIYTPQGEASSEDVAEEIIELSKTTKKPILASFLGGKRVEKGMELLRDNRVPAYSSPERAVKSYMYMYQYSRNLEQLYQTPEELPPDRAPPKYHLKAMIGRVARIGREMLTERESKKFLQTYGIPVSETHVSKNPAAAANVAARLGFPVVLKIHSPDITYKSDCGGVILGLSTRDEVKAAFNQIIACAKERHPEARVDAVSVQRMVTGVDYELLLGCKRDPTFGPAIVFGQGGTGVEIYRDIAVALPPLNRLLSRRLMEQTKVHSLLQGYRNKSPANMGLLEEYLVRFSQLIMDFPQIKEVDINPLVVVGDEFIALDARILIDKDLTLAGVEPHSHLVIEPYPRKYIERWILEDGRPVTLRPIRPEDEPLQFSLFRTLSPETYKLRFFGPVKKLTHNDMVRFTNIDYRREMAIIAELTEKRKRKIIGVARLFIDPDGESGELAVVVGDPWQDLGLGTKLVDTIIGVGENKGISTIWGFIQADNERMIHICREMGFNIEMVDSSMVKATLKLG